MQDEADVPVGQGNSVSGCVSDVTLANLVSELVGTDRTLHPTEAAAQMGSGVLPRACLIKPGQDQADGSPTLLIRLDELERLLTKYLALKSYKCMSERMQATPDLPAVPRLVIQLERKGIIPPLGLGGGNTSDAT
jgi:hypothetical protein